MKDSSRPQGQEPPETKSMVYPRNEYLRNGPGIRILSYVQLGSDGLGAQHTVAPLGSQEGVARLLRTALDPVVAAPRLCSRPSAAAEPASSLRGQSTC